jgi:ABC-type phosphate transport system ATPase subunit
MRSLVYCDLSTDMTILLQAQPGSNIDNCIEEAIHVCLEERACVILTHNGEQYKFDYKDIMNSWYHGE